MTLRALPAILGDLQKQGQCPEVAVRCTCGHQRPAAVQLAPFLQDKREPRSAARALRTACRRDAVPSGDAGTVLVSAPGDACPSCGRGAGLSLWCGGVAMDLPAAGQNTEGIVPVGIGARQFLEWLEMEPSGTGSVKIQLSAGTSADEASWRCLFATVGGRILLCSLAWVLACLAYALLIAPELLAERPEQLYRQIQDQIRNIPLPVGSPHYAFYRRHYLEQYQQLLKGMQEMETSWAHDGRPRFNLPVFLRGLALGTWLLIVSLAICEYRYCTISVWIEMLAEWRPTFAWPSWLERSRDDDSWAEGEAGGAASGSGADASGSSRRPASSSAKSPAQGESAASAKQRKKKQQRGACTKAITTQDCRAEVRSAPLDDSGEQQEEVYEAATSATSLPKDILDHPAAYPELATTQEGPSSARRAADTEVPSPDASPSALEVVEEANFDGDGVQEPPPGGMQREVESCQDIRTAGSCRAEAGPVRGRRSPDEVCDAINMAVAAAGGAAPPPPQTFVWDDCKCDGVKCSRADSSLTTEAGDASGEPSLVGSEDACAVDASAVSEAGTGAEGQCAPPSMTPPPALWPLSGVELPPGLEKLPPGLENVIRMSRGLQSAGEESQTNPGSPTAAHELPPDLESMSTNELISLFFDESLRVELGRRGVPLRKHLLRCLRLLQQVPEHTADSHPGASGSNSSSSGCAGGSPLRADAPEFTPSAPELCAASLPGLALEGATYEGVLQALIEGLTMAEAAEPIEPETGLPADPCWEHHYCSRHFQAVASAKWHASRLQAETS